MPAASPYKPGQQIVCTISKAPISKSANETIKRLMRLDPANTKALRRAQRMRRQRMIVYNRGNRDWVSREKPARVIEVAAGNNWTMTFSLDLAGDLKRVAPFVTVKTK